MKTTTQRLESLDALRGFDMFWIVGGGAIFLKLAELIDLPVFNWIAGQMVHVKWDGFTFWDMIFPLFLFLAGVSFPFSVNNSIQKGLSRRFLYLKIIKRGFVLVLLGLVYNGVLKSGFTDFRFASVLGRIGLAWMFAALLFINTKNISRIIWCVGLLIGYWLIITFIPAPDFPGAERFSMEGNIASYIDRLFLPGRLLLKVHDPEGLLSTIPAISTALLGMFTGQFVMMKKENISETKKTGIMAIFGILLIGISLLWSLIYPINKNLWSSSFVCLAGGLSILFFCLFYYIIDVRGYRKWAFFFRIIGLNSITIYLGQRIIHFSYTSGFLFGGMIKLFPESWASLLNSITYVGVCWFFLYFLYKQKIFLKV